MIQYNPFSVALKDILRKAGSKEAPHWEHRPVELIDAMDLQSAYLETTHHLTP